MKMVANMHGNEPVGRELLVHLAKYILRFDREILETTDLYILPTMNPDGFDRAFEGRCDGITYSAGRLSEGIDYSAVVQTTVDLLGMQLNFTPLNRAA